IAASTLPQGGDIAIPETTHTLGTPLHPKKIKKARPKKNKSAILSAEVAIGTGEARMVVRCIVGSAVALVSLNTATAAPLPQGGVFTYSDQCVSRRSGDTYGYRIVLLRGVGGYIWAVVYVDNEAPSLGFAKYGPN